MNTTKQEKSIKELFRKKCWSYLSVNFRKFTTENKIKIALALVCKDMEKDNPVGQTQLIIIRDAQKTELLKQVEDVHEREISFNT